MSRETESFESRRYMAQNGYYTNPAPFGYRNTADSLAINKSQATYVQMMFDWKTEGHFSSPWIAHELNRLGVKTKNSHPWSKSSVDYVLHNPVYVGKLRFDGLIYPAKHAPIISEEQFYKINSHANETE